MSYLGSVYDIGVAEGSPVIGTPVASPAPGQEYIASGPGRLTPSVPQMLPSEVDDVTRNFGPQVWAAMLTDPAVSSSYLSIKLSILSGSVQIQPRLKPPAYRYTPPSARPERPQDGGADALSPAQSQAQEAAEFCERELARLKDPFKSTLLEMLDCMAFGVKLAESTRELCESGPDAGRLVLRSLKVKPQWAWNFVVDSFMNVVGIITFVPSADAGKSESGFLILPPEKFASLAWLPKDGDPRGTSSLRPAYDWWNLKQQVKPQFYQHLRRFGSPSLDGMLSPTDLANRPMVDAQGREIPGAIASPGQAFMTQLLAFQNNTVIVRAAGSELNVLEPKSNGEAFLNAFDLFDRQICLAIGLQARASLEAKHGSKADSDTAENTRGLVITYGRELVANWIERHVLYKSVEINFGKAVADELMPEVCFSETESQDFAANLTAAAGAGYTIGRSQLPGVDVMLNMPERDMEADDQHAQEAAQQQAELMAKTAPATAGPPGKAKEGPKPAKPKDKSTNKGAK